MSAFREKITGLRRQLPPEEEDANRLKFNEEFKSGTDSEYACLSLSEAAILLEQAKVENSENHGTIVNRMIEYCKTFRTFKDTETVREVRRTLNKYDLHEYEVAQLINLVPSTVEEAKTYIPSLNLKFSDEIIDEIIKDVNELMKYQG
ncbi:HRDC-like protein [Glomus cerebriforme]|uniref:HRDC-like protein n=1 Tax=Glomus cerebriforme TaxID=658196 RepID=A0A397TI33_9GLOM|nr:HRDC-like protein [Glomus cerebriforme]